MRLKLTISPYISGWLRTRILKRIDLRSIALLSIVLATLATTWSWSRDLIVAYGDAESHLNIAKRVVHSLTPGAAQLGGIWLPLPHILMIPFVYFDALWRTGLAGSIVSGAAYVVSSVYLYRLAYLMTKSKFAALGTFLVFAVNPNILYLQSTPMTELPLTAFFVLSSYYFVAHVRTPTDYLALVKAAFFALCASMSRYDGWLLVVYEALTVLVLHGIGTRMTSVADGWRRKITLAVDRKAQGTFILYSTLAALGIVMWLGWGWLILGDPLYFTNSSFSAKSQQQGWLAKGQLPAYHNLGLSIVYYFVNAMSSVGVIIFAVSVMGAYQYLHQNFNRERILTLGVLASPVVFYVVTLFLGQSIIFIPHVTPVGFEWRLFNVRYGVMALPVVSVMFGWLISHASLSVRVLLVSLYLVNMGLFAVGYARVVTLDDGTIGLSSSKRTGAEAWVRENYDGGLVLMDDYARTMSVIRARIPMQNIIYVGNKPYWEESLVDPAKYARWIITQKDDVVWKQLIVNHVGSGRLYASFEKVYTSNEILVFKKID